MLPMLRSTVKKGELTFAPGPMLAEWTGLEPATPGVTGRTSYYFCFLISTLLAARSINFAQSCPFLSIHVAQKWHSRLRLGTREFTRFLAPAQGAGSATGSGCSHDINQ